MEKEVITAVAIGFCLSACCGFRVFVPMLFASIAAKAGIIPLNEGFQWLAGWPALACFATATILEIIAYYIPFIDNLLDAITTPLAVVGGTLLMTSVLPVDNDFLKWVTGFIFGGGAAATIQGGSILTRLASSKMTGGAGNAVVATGEHAAAFGISGLSLFLPVLVGLILFMLISFFIYKFIKKILRRNTARISRNPSGS